MKIFGSSALILDVVFMALVGIHASNEGGTFAKNHPWLYSNLSFFGLRVPDDENGKLLTED
jgi:hypothetical protein